MAKCVAPGHLKINDDNLGLHPKNVILNLESKNSEIDGLKGGSRIAGRKRKALNDAATKKKSPQPEAPSKEDISSEDEFSWHDHQKCIEQEEDISSEDGISWHDYQKCIEQEKAAEMMSENSLLGNIYPLKFFQFSEDDCCLSVQVGEEPVGFSDRFKHYMDASTLPDSPYSSPAFACDSS